MHYCVPWAWHVVGTYIFAEIVKFWSYQEQREDFSGWDPGGLESALRAVAGRITRRETSAESEGGFELAKQAGTEG